MTNKDSILMKALHDRVEDLRKNFYAEEKRLNRKRKRWSNKKFTEDELEELHYHMQASQNFCYEDILYRLETLDVKNLTNLRKEYDDAKNFLKWANEEVSEEP